MTTSTILAPVALDQANDTVRPVLEGIQKAYGEIPNLMAGMANSPALLHGYLALNAQFEKTSLTAEARQFILLAVSEINECRFCSAAHSAALKHMLRIDAEKVEAVRDRRPTGDTKLDALLNLAQALTERRGQNVDLELNAFFAAGYTEAQVGEVLIGIGLKTMSNYLDHLGQYELGMFEPEGR